MSEVFGHIILERKSQFLNRLKNYRVIINGTEQGRIGNGKTEEYEVPAGENTITCKVNWCSSNDYIVNVQPGKKAFLKVGSGIKYFWPVYIVLLITIIARFFMRTDTELRQKFNLISIFVLIPVVCYFLYYITISRRAYLKIEDDVDNIFAK